MSTSLRALIVASLLAACMATYSVGSLDTLPSDCPDGLHIALDGTAAAVYECCVTATAALGIAPSSFSCNTDGTFPDGNYDNYPSGCYKVNEAIGYNHHPSGSANPARPPICGITVAAGTEGDPHTTGLHGEHFDLHGKHGALLNLLSAKNVSLNARVEEHAFNVFNLKVYGSFFVAMYFTLRTNSSGRMTNLEYDPRYPPALFDKIPLVVGSKIVEMEDLRVCHEDPDSIQLNTSGWSFTITAKSIEYGVVQSWMIKQRHTAIKQLRLDLVPLTDPLQHGIAPHGIIGQTADGDDKAIDGKQDDLTELAKTAEKGPGGLKSVHPTAQGEGAIEGTIDEYIVLGSVFETKFKYSRFDATSAPVRDTSKLTGTRRARTSGSAGASGDDSIPGDQALESA